LTFLCSRRHPKKCPSCFNNNKQEKIYTTQQNIIEQFMLKSFAENFFRQPLPAILAATLHDCRLASEARTLLQRMATMQRIFFTCSYQFSTGAIMEIKQIKTSRAVIHYDSYVSKWASDVTVKEYRLHIRRTFVW
jgi:hypothetical protein